MNSFKKHKHQPPNLIKIISHSQIYAKGFYARWLSFPSFHFSDHKKTKWRLRRTLNSSVKSANRVYHNIHEDCTTLEGVPRSMCWPSSYWKAWHHQDSLERNLNQTPLPRGKFPFLLPWYPVNLPRFLLTASLFLPHPRYWLYLTSQVWLHRRSECPPLPTIFSPSLKKTLIQSQTLTNRNRFLFLDPQQFLNP